MSVNDLTNTTWKINTSTVSAGYGIFSINFITLNSEPEFENSTLAIGYDYDVIDRDYFASSNTLLCMPSFYYMGQNEEFLITSGTDVTNSDLISWLENNAINLTPSPELNSSILKIYSNDGRETSYNIYVDGVFAINVPRTFNITININFGSYSGATTINFGGTAIVTLNSRSPYSLPETITVIGASYTYTQNTPNNGTVILSNPTRNVTINCECIIHSGGSD